MQLKKLYHQGYFLLGIILIGCILFTFGCNGGEVNPSGQDNSRSREEQVIITGNGVMKESRMTLQEMLVLPDAQFEHVYSIINNWPTKKELVARGVKLAAVLQAAGISDEAKCITVRGEDGYEWSFTREQLLETTRYYFPHVKNGDPSGAELVEPIIAYEYMENSNQLSDARAESLCLIIPQANVNEQTYHTFVKGIKEIVVTIDDPGKWEVATVFPPAGNIARGDKAKLQHKEIGKVKMYYTLDGSIPTEGSTLYNPSTYQPELNKPIVINENTTIKVLVKGFGKYDSDVAEYRYQVR